MATSRAKGTRRKKKAAPEPRGLTAAATRAEPPDEIKQLAELVEGDGGAVLASYREPFGGRWLLLATLPIDRIIPTPFQRDVSPTHVARLQAVIEKIGRFLDPIIVVRRPDGVYWTPNGNHRLSALRALGGRSVVVLLLPEAEMAYTILALNTEKAHNLREKSLEVIRMARDLAGLDEVEEMQFAFAFEEPSFLTLGICYEQRGRFAGGAYHPILRRVDDFLRLPISRALAERERRAVRLLEIDDRVNEIVAALKERGMVSPYLKAFVVARLNPLRFQRGAKAELDPTLEKISAAAHRFDPARVKQGDIARAGGPPVADEAS
jgi:ParB family chromosome partitioning protein